MGALLSGYITLEKLEEIVRVTKSKQEKGFKFSVSISEQSNQFGQNVSFFAEQTKEQREAKQPKYYFGNGKVFWTDGTIKVAEKQEQAQQASTGTQVIESDLPF
jgi:hypothetical protein